MAHLAQIIITVLFCVTSAELKQSQLIVGGRESRPGRMPWMVSIDSPQYGFICGGTLITPFYVLTAAHCVNGAPVDLTVSFGGFNRTRRDFAQTIRIAEIIIHERFSTQNQMIWDVALIRLPLAVSIIPGRVDMISMATFLQDFRGSDGCWIGGWGRTVPDRGDGREAPLSPVLHEKNVSTLTLSECRSRWRNSLTQPRVTWQHICVDDEEGKVSACQGDSGSPLVCEDDGILYVAGISSWGSSACRAYPSVYTRVSYFFTWIIDHITYNGQKQEHKLWQSLFLKWLRKRSENH